MLNQTFYKFLFSFIAVVACTLALVLIIGAGLGA